MNRHRLVSLRDMLQLPIGILLRAAADVAALGQGLSEQVSRGNGIHMPTETYEAELRNLEEFISSAGYVGLDVAKALAIDLRDNMGKISRRDAKGVIFDPAGTRRLHSNLRAITACLDKEAHTKFMLVLDANSASLYEASEPAFGADVAAKFPSLAYDVSEAGKCLGLKRSTAAAFHSIRCLEAGFAALWRCVGVADPISGFERNWTNRVTKVQDAIESRWPKRTGRLGGDAQFFDVVVGILAALQNPYRNTTMHFDAIYTEGEAELIFGIVKGLMQKIASRMDENGLPLA